MSEFKPNHSRTLRERIEVARKFDNLHKRPDTEDWAWYDCERSETEPRQREVNPTQESYVL